VPARVANKRVKTPKTAAANVGGRVGGLSAATLARPVPFEACVETSDARNLLFLSGMLPVVNRKLVISGRLGKNLSLKEGQQAVRIAAFNALATARHHLGTLRRVKKLVKLTVLIATTEKFVDHAQLADAASEIFVQIFGRKAGHTRLVYGVQSLPIHAPVTVDCVFEIRPA
jgi:enamine deaminase RidA (YjgF/YER057c/UK114 family)